MKLSLTRILNEISRWKKEGYTEASSFELINDLIGYVRAGESGDSGYWIHFTNNPNKIGINPKSDYGLPNPYGYYGFPVDLDLIENIKIGSGGLVGHLLDYSKFFVIFKPKPSVNIVDYNEISFIIEQISDKYDMDSLSNPSSSKKVQSEITKKLISMGIDGVISRNYSMSGDIKSEIVIFSPSNVDVKDIKINSIVDDAKAYEKQKELESRPALEKYKDFNPKNAPEDMSQEKIQRAVQKNYEYHRLASPLDYHKKRSRQKRKDVHKRGL